MRLGGDILSAVDRGRQADKQTDRGRFRFSSIGTETEETTRR